MYKDRRRRIIPPESLVESQLYKWNWDSHLWGSREGGQLACDWCDWICPSECPTSAVPLCKKNPEVQKLRDENMAKFREAMEIMSQTFKSAFK